MVHAFTGLGNVFTCSYLSLAKAGNVHVSLHSTGITCRVSKNMGNKVVDHLWFLIKKRKDFPFFLIFSGGLISLSL